MCVDLQVKFEILNDLSTQLHTTCVGPERYLIICDLLINVKVGILRMCEHEFITRASFFIYMLILSNVDSLSL